MFNGRMAIATAVAVVLGTLTARLLNGPGDLLDFGLFGFNSGLLSHGLRNSRKGPLRIAQPRCSTFASSLYPGLPAS